MKTWGVALIGCGQMGEVHLSHIYYKKNVRISCVCDLNPARGEEIARKYRAESVETDAARCISREDVDIVIIATYPSTHLELLKLCLENGKHVICEKPITPTLEEGEEFVRLVKAHPECKVLIGHILRHNVTYQKAAEMIQNGAIGHPVIMRMSQNHHTMNWPRYLQLIEETAPVVDCGVHYLDVMKWFSGEEIQSVSGIGMRTDPEVPEDKHNYEMITVRLSNGSVGFYEAGWTKTINADNLKEFVGPLGSLRIVFRNARYEHQEEGDLIEYYSLADKTYHTINVMAERKPTDLQFDHLIRMIEEDVPATPTIDEVFDCFRVAMEAERVIRENLGHHPV